MSAPDTNLDRQARQHRFPLWGIIAALVFGAAMGAAITFTATDASGPSGADMQIDGRTGEVEAN
ncbi:hypothetical protein ACRARG_16795 [Pseudooceanicola sp. C21-150M6]|uniref:hypothetical protein n=1 Tax=Pseudooceanicola sp. C21-150M6 TaxID=3434355 RepID=UPI003D7FB907